MVKSQIRPRDRTTVLRWTLGCLGRSRSGEGVDVPVESRILGQRAQLLAGGNEAAELLPGTLRDGHTAFALSRG